MGSSISVPRSGARMAVPMRFGQQAAWPVSTLPLESLEAAAQDWYAFRDRSCTVKLYNNFASLLVFMFIGIFVQVFSRVVGRAVCVVADLDCEGMGRDREFSCWFLLPPCLILLAVGAMMYVKCVTLPRLNSEVQQRLAVPLTQLLAGTGWVVQARYLRRDKGTRAPETLEQGCCSPGWLWLDFEPAALAPVVGAPVAHVMQQPSQHELQPFQAQPFQQQHFQQGTHNVPLMQALGPVPGVILPVGGGVHSQDPEIVRAGEIQPCMAQAAPPSSPYQSMA